MQCRLATRNRFQCVSQTSFVVSIGAIDLQLNIEYGIKELSWSVINAMLIMKALVYCITLSGKWGNRSNARQCASLENRIFMYWDSTLIISYTVVGRWIPTILNVTASTYRTRVTVGWISVGFVQVAKSGSVQLSMCLYRKKNWRSQICMSVILSVLLVVVKWYFGLSMYEFRVEFPKSWSGGVSSNIRRRSQGQTSSISSEDCWS